MADMAPTIWLVDDNEDLRYGLALHLTDCGFRVVEMGGSMEALKRLDTGEALALLVTDLKLAKGQPNGIALANMVRLRHAGLPVIFLTGANDIDPRDIGNTGRLVLKPIELDALTAIIRDMLDA